MHFKSVGREARRLAKRCTTNLVVLSLAKPLNRILDSRVKSQADPAGSIHCATSSFGSSTPTELGGLAPYGLDGEDIAYVREGCEALMTRLAHTHTRRCRDEGPLESHLSIRPRESRVET